MPTSPSSGSPGAASAPILSAPPTRAVLRQQRLAARQAFAAGPAFEAAQSAILGHLRALLEQLEPTLLGLYWPVRGEFSAGVQPWQPVWPAGTPLALPQALRASPAGEPARMVYRRFTGPDTPARDDYGLPTADGAPCSPDVLLVPCVGFTDAGFRLGYGGGFFDRYRAAHPGITTVGIAWRQARLSPDDFVPEAHDLPLDVVLTEAGVFGS